CAGHVVRVAPMLLVEPLKDRPDTGLVITHAGQDLGQPHFVHVEGHTPRAPAVSVDDELGVVLQVEKEVVVDEPPRLDSGGRPILEMRTSGAARGCEGSWGTVSVGGGDR